MLIISKFMNNDLHGKSGSSRASEVYSNESIAQRQNHSRIRIENELVSCYLT